MRPGAGDDTVYGGGGNDQIGTSEGDDRLFGGAEASIVDSDLVANSVSIQAESVSRIDATVVAVAASVSVSASGDSTAVAIGASVSDNMIGWQDTAVAADHQSDDSTALAEGDVVEVTEGAHRGRFYEYIGAGQASAVDLSVEDYGDTQKWKQVGLSREGALTSAHLDDSSITTGLDADAALVDLLRPLVHFPDFGNGRELGTMAKNVRENNFSIADLRGGTFTISNLGAIGGTYSTPIINTPETAILLIGRSRKMPIVVDDQIAVRLMMPQDPK